MRRIALCLLFAGAMAGCVMGPRYDHVAARTGRGAHVDVRTESGTRLRGELLGWSDQGLVLASTDPATGPLMLVPTAAVRHIDVPGLGHIEDEAARRGTGDVRFAARYPQGIDDPLLQRLLAAYGQPRLERAS